MALVYLGIGVVIKINGEENKKEKTFSFFYFLDFRPRSYKIPKDAVAFDNVGFGSSRFADATKYPIFLNKNLLEPKTRAIGGKPQVKAPRRGHVSSSTRYKERFRNRTDADRKRHQRPHSLH